jgi:hypothetical protein
MNMKLVICTLIIFLAVTSSACAITASLGNSRMILRANVTPETPALLNGSIIVNNVNPNPIQINITTDDVLKKNLSIVLTETIFELQPDEDREVFFTLKAYRPGTYDGKLFVAYSMATVVNGTNKTEHAGMAANIKAIIYGPEGNYTEPAVPIEKPEQKPISSVLIGIGIIAVIIIIGLAIYFIIEKKR